MSSHQRSSVSKMSCDSNRHSSEMQQPQKCLEIRQDDKFFSMLMSKETSMANSSSRVYYGRASVGVPFMWELHPGTPKLPSCDNIVPPLTPPPSYHSSLLKSKSKHRKSLKPTLFTSIFHCFNYASCSRSPPVHSCMDDDDDDDIGSPTSTLCFRVK